MTEATQAAGPTSGERSGLLVLSVVSNILALALPLALLQVYDRIVPNQAQGTAVVLFTAVLIALLADGFLRYVRFRVLARIAARFEFASAQDLVERVFAAKLPDLMRMRYGSLRSAVTALTQSRDLYTGQGLLPLFDAPFGVIFLLLVWYIGGALVLVPIAILLILGLLALWSGGLQRQSLSDLASAEQERSGLLAQCFAGLESYKMLGLAGPVFHRFIEVEADRADADRRSEQLSGFFTDMSQTGSQAATIAIALLGSLVVLQGEMTTGGLAACSILGGRGIGSLLGLVGAWSRRQGARAADAHVSSILELASRDARGEPAVAQDSGSDRAPSSPGPLEVRFIDVTVARPGAKLAEVNLEIPAGAVVAVELDRRADAELLLQAVTGLEEVDSGRIELRSGQSEDSRLVAPAAYTAFVPARPAIFAGSILDNLSLFDRSLRPLARELAAEIGLTAIADRLPRGLRTEVGYETIPILSAGAIKRIALVRALIREPRLLALQSPGRWLDVDGITRLRAMLEARRDAMTVLLATGDQKLLELAELGIRLDDSSKRIQITDQWRQA